MTRLPQLVLFVIVWLFRDISFFGDCLVVGCLFLPRRLTRIHWFNNEY